MISFDMRKRSYFLKLCKLNVNEDLFVKLKNYHSHLIHRKTYIMVSNKIFEINPIKETSSILICDSTINRDERIFIPNESPIIIGRDKICHFPFSNDKYMSRVQSTIMYDPINECWTLMDGRPDKPSLKGTWVHAYHPIELKNNSEFRLKKSVFRVSMKFDFIA